jgi:hypothetical protein
MVTDMGDRQPAKAAKGMEGGAEQEYMTEDFRRKSGYRSDGV